LSGAHLLHATNIDAPQGCEFSQIDLIDCYDDEAACPNDD